MLNLKKTFNQITASPWLTIAFSFFVILALATGIPNLSISNDFRVYLGKQNPQLKAFEKFEDNYTQSNSATIVVRVKDGDLFTVNGLKAIQELTEQAWLLPYSARVSSLANYTHLYASGDEIISGYLYDDTRELTIENIQSIRKIATNEPKLLNSLLTADGKVAVIFVSLNLPKSEANASIKVTEATEKLRDKFRKIYPELQIDNGGSTAFNTTLARAVASDISTLLPLSYFIIFAGLLFFLKSFIGTTAIFLLITCCLVATFGFFGWVSPTLTPIAGFAPSILLSIMVADSVHIIVSYLQYLKQGLDKKSAIIESLMLNFNPVLITSVTTILGFLSLNFSASPPYRDLGNMVAFGVLLAFIFSITLLPALLMVLPHKKASTINLRISFKPFAKWVIAKKRQLLIGMTALTIGLIAFIPQNKLSDNWAKYFNNSFELMQLVNFLDGYLTGINGLEYSLEPIKGKTIFDDEYLQELDNFHLWFESQPKIMNVKSYSELMKGLNQVMNQDQSSFYRLPSTPELAAQYLLFYELGLPQGLGLNNLITIHQNATRLSVSITDSGSDELLKIDQQAQNWLTQNAPHIKPTSATGLGVVFAHIAQRNIKSLLLGTLVALAGISIVLMLVFKSVKYGLISLIPNLIPAALAYGFWGATFGYVDIALSIVACSTLGIVVDDTVHFLYKYIQAKKAHQNTEAAVVSVFNRVGLALLTTSSVLAAGFLILVASNMNTSSNIGLLMAITLVFALLVDFLLLPALLLYWDKTKLKKNKQKS